MADLLQFQLDCSCSVPNSRSFCEKCQLGWIEGKPLILCERVFPEVQSSGPGISITQCPSAIHRDCHGSGVSPPWCSVLSADGVTRQTYCPSCASAISINADVYSKLHLGAREAGALPRPLAIAVSYKNISWKPAEVEAQKVLQAVVSQSLLALPGKEEPVNYSIDYIIGSILYTLSKLTVRPIGNYRTSPLDEIYDARVQVYPKPVAVEAALAYSSDQFYDSATTSKELRHSRRTHAILTVTAQAKQYLSPDSSEDETKYYHAQGVLIDPQLKVVLLCEPNKREMVDRPRLMAQLRTPTSRSCGITNLTPNGFRLFVIYGTRDEMRGGDCSVAAIHMMLLISFLPLAARIALIDELIKTEEKDARCFDCTNSLALHPFFKFIFNCCFSFIKFSNTFIFHSCWYAPTRWKKVSVDWWMGSPGWDCT